MTWNLFGIPEFKKQIDKDKHLITIVNNFKRKIPQDSEYYNRLLKEFKLIVKFNFSKCFLQVIDILDMTKNIPHIIRGSSGSSLTCYLLGISSFDPIKYNISLARFMHKKRPNLPDIDIDFPYNRRDEIFKKIYDKWDNKVARISNHNIYHEKSAMRQAIRDNGHNKFVPRYFSLNTIFKNNNVKVKKVKKRKEDLIGTFRCYSLHCGGIVIFDEDIPDDLLVKNKQLVFNKDDVEENGFIKIDILSNRGIAQLYEIDKRPLDCYPDYDKKTIDLLCRGDNVGLTFAESPGMRKIFRTLQPKCVDDIAQALALIRPAATESKNVVKNLDTALIYDDDAIQYIQKILNCSESDADIYRKAFTKNKTKLINEFSEKINNHKNKNLILRNLKTLHYYSFCKSHAYSYAQLVWALAYHKANNPKKFWKSTINNCHSMYKKWVHYSEAKKSKLNVVIGSPPWTIKNNTLVNGPQQLTLFNNPVSEYYKYGYWTDQKFLPGMYCKKKDNIISFKGIIATFRKYKRNKHSCTYVTIGYDNGKYLDLVFNGVMSVYKKNCVEGKGKFNTSNFGIEVSEYKIFTI